MKVFICCLCFILLPTMFFGQQHGYFQQQADFKLNVTLHPDTKTLDGDVHILYTNNSPDTLHFIWFHLWPNAYKSEATAFGEQLLQNGRTDFYFSDDEKKGYINRLNFRVKDREVQLQDHPLYIDIAKLLLPEPLAPGESITIETPFHEKLPYLWSRGGYAGDFFSITQWYPKPAVYDRDGWHPMPYLDQGEFYSEFGNYQVTITVPRSYTVAATGNEVKNSEQDGNKTIMFEQNNIHDFAWFASPGWTVDSTSIISEDGHSIQLFTYYRPDDAGAWDKSLELLKQSIREREGSVGPYPYDVAKVVQSPVPFSGGMEYPTITNIQNTADAGVLHELINHEAGHNWFYGALASNERMHPWMDEGFNSFFTNREARTKIDSITAGQQKSFLRSRMPENVEGLFFRNAISQKTDQPINTPSAIFSENNYYLTAYYKTTVWLQRLEQYLGKDVFNNVVRKYYRDWKFRHPQPEDFKKIAEDVSGRNLDSVFQLLDKKGYIAQQPKKQFKLGSFFSLKNTDKYSYLFIAPAVGYNFYDKLMAGLLLHNYTLPEPAFHFFLSPMYGTGSKSLTGLGRIGYSHTSYGKIRKFEIALSGATYNIDAYTDSTGRKNFMDFSKIVPSVKLTFRNRNPRSQVNAFVQWKTFFINEQSISFQIDTVSEELVIAYPRHSRYLNQLQLTYDDQRALYPYSAVLTAEQSDNFVRIGFEGKYFFNYRTEGGLDARFFAGKFFYLGDNRIYNSRYYLNMTGANGEEDYTYSNYFLGRNEFQKLPSQQIMIRDGGFKVRTDMLSNKVGKTDDWLTALNMNTTIPKKINPLSVIPLDITLKAFLDIGTYAEAWQKNAPTGKFLYDAGLQLSLVKNIINIYIPIFYSKVYKDYIKSTIPRQQQFWNTISFSIDIQNFRLKKILEY